MLDLVANEVFLTKGIGVHEDKLTSFEFALRDAGISGTNIVLISSIFPPEAKLIPRKEGLKKIKPGQILFTIYSKNQTNEPHRLINYLETLCSSFHSIWNKGKDNESLRFIDIKNINHTKVKLFWIQNFRIIVTVSEN